MAKKKNAPRKRKPLYAYVSEANRAFVVNGAKKTKTKISHFVDDLLTKHRSA